MSPALSCATARAHLHLGLDGEPLPPALRSELDEHLESCSACHEASIELREIQTALRGLARPALPQAALQAVWAQTSRSPGSRCQPVRRHGLLLKLAAALILALAGSGLWLLREHRPAGPSPAEVARASTEARLVLELTARALQKTERVAYRTVLADEVSPALRSVPIDWPGEGAGPRRSRDGV